MDFVIDLGFESDCGMNREGADHTNALADWVGGDDTSRVDLGTETHGNAKDSPQEQRSFCKIVVCTCSPARTRRRNWCAKGGG